MERAQTGHKACPSGACAEREVDEDASPAVLSRARFGVRHDVMRPMSLAVPADRAIRLRPRNPCSFGRRLGSDGKKFELTAPNAGTMS